MKTQSQYTKLLAALKTWCSPLDGLEKAGTMKLSTRCGELEDKGYKIERKWAPSKAYKLYRLAR